jgi:hypothetical protein
MEGMVKMVIFLLFWWVFYIIKESARMGIKFIKTLNQNLVGLNSNFLIQNIKK